MITTDPRDQMLLEMSECAHRLGMAFAAEAERAETTARRLEYFQLFDRYFFSVRVAIALGLRLRGAARAEAAEREGERPEPAERAEREPAYDERDRERDREVEPASLPVLLRTLDGIAAEAASLPGTPPAELPALRELLAQVKSERAPEPRRTAGALRARLAGSATAVTPPPARSPRPGFRALPVRRATGPPPKR